MSLVESLAKSETIIIAEVAQAHDGSLKSAHEYIDLVADTGASAVKFQTHIAHAESTIREPWRVKMATPDKTRFDYWQRMEFKESEWVELRDHCTNRGLSFMSSPFSIEALDLLDRLGVEVWKLASGEVSNTPLVKAMIKTKKPIILSTGLSTIAELDEVVNLILGSDIDLTILQCTSEYPCPPELTGLNLITEFKKKWGCRVGISDHSGTIFPSLAAKTLGASVIEVHITSSRDSKGVDSPSSITPEELRMLVSGVKFLDAAIKNPADKTRLSASAEEMRRIFGRSVVANSDLEVGHRIQISDLVYKKPGGGLSWKDIGTLINRRVVRPVLRDDLITEENTSEATK